MNEQNTYRSSIYNFQIPLDDGGSLLYNSLSGAVIQLEGHDAEKICEQLTGKRKILNRDLYTGDIFNLLHKGGFIINNDFDEMHIIKERYYKARGETPIVLTITTTMDCNLGCYYCYESRSKQTLKLTDIESIIQLSQKLIKQSPKKSFHVDWYGGEPLMNIEFLEAASLTLQELCTSNNVNYRASVISNGTCWPSDVSSFIKKHKINQVQISFDGLKGNHDKRRRYRKDYKPSEDASSFDKAIELIDKLIQCTRVDLRFNIDRRNKDDLPGFIDLIKKRGWFKAAYPLVFQPARLASYTEKSSFMRNYELGIEEFDQIRAFVRKEIGDEGSIEESEIPDGFPYPKTSVCAALANNSVVIGAEGAQYRCGLQVGELNRAVGNIRFQEIPIKVKNPDEDWWNKYDPTENEKCSKCSFLPICWGGCPKKHLENDKHAIAEQGEYWRNNLAKQVASRFKKTVKDNHTFTMQDQFRNS